MLSGESAYGKFPYKSVDVMATVAKHTEQSMLSYAVRARTYTRGSGPWATCGLQFWAHPHYSLILDRNP